MELNEKLAVWAGFGFCEDVPCPYASMTNHVHWPDGGASGLDGLPDFTTSLDALFEWLVPVLRERYGEVRIAFYNPDGTECVHITKRNPSKDEQVFLAFQSAETSAGALAQAAEKLLDGVVASRDKVPTSTKV